MEKYEDVEINEEFFVLRVKLKKINGWFFFNIELVLKVNVELVLLIEKENNVVIFFLYIYIKYVWKSKFSLCVIFFNEYKVWYFGKVINV